MQAPHFDRGLPLAATRPARAGGFSLRVRLDRRLPAAPEVIWALLRGGPAGPLALRLPDRVGGVGRSRELSTPLGVIRQRVLTWTPGRRLVAEMVGSTLTRARWLRGLEEDLQLTPAGRGTRLVWTLRVRLAGPLAPARAPAVYWVVARLQRAAARAWRARLLAAARSASGGRIAILPPFRPIAPARRGHATP